MEEIRLYDINSIEFSELIDAARVELKNNNPEYKELQNKVSEIMEMYPNLQLLFEDDKAMNLNEEECKIVSSVRSSIDSAKDALTAKVCYLSEFLGGDCVTEGDYPAWEYRKESKLRDIMVDSYKELFGDGPEVKAIHAGLECGLFYDKIERLDCVSFGPTMIDIHTTEEKLSIPSTKKMWKYLVRTLEKMNTIQ